MTQEDMIRMAREAGWKDLRDFDSEMNEDILMGRLDDLVRFAQLVEDAAFQSWVAHTRQVVLAEREACAKVVEAFEPDDKDLAMAIRARGQQ